MDLSKIDLTRPECFIGGEWTAAQSGETVAVDNPASQKIIGAIPKMTAVEAKRAIEAAARALPAWRAQTGKARAAVLRRWFELTIANAEPLARLMTLEQGKPLAEARGEVGYAASFLEWFGEEAKRAGGEIVPSFKPRAETRITREPIGCAAMITPWNFPLAMITRKAGAALAAGCAAVVKPSELTPYSALALARLAQAAGAPDGVLNVVTGDADSIGKEMCAHPLVRALSFTGSTRVGKTLAAQCAPTVKKLALELGGNAPFIVFADADLARAAEQMMASKFRNAGQTCVSANRVYVEDSIYDNFAQIVAEKIAALKVGDGFEEGITQGPLINQAAIEKTERHIAQALAAGARAVVGGRRHARGGNFFEPTLLTEMQDGMPPDEEETFGPVAPLYRFRTEEEAIRRANATPYGLAAYFCSSDLGRVMRVADALEAGMIGVNEGIISSETAPFGGYKESGIGREGARVGIDEYLEIKYTLIGY